ncbi:ANTAR domain-containing protein [Streptomyces sp. NPDC006173]|uniref:ANTAR domain-containing protein n=1 Tax=Streptomyces sp. NPDC006173 TaxID=3155349 RepID=UPI0033C8502C
MSQLLTSGHDEHAAVGAGTDEERISPSVRSPREGARQETADQAVDRATGVVMALGRLDGGRAGAVLREVVQRTGIPLPRIAELLTVWAPTGELNLGLRIALEEAIRDQHRVRTVDQSTGRPVTAHGRAGAH